MSRMTNGWIASAGKLATSAAAIARRRLTMRERFKDSAGEQTIEVVVEGEEGKSHEQRETQALPDLHGPFGDGTAFHDFGEIIHQVPSIEQRYGQEIEHAEAHAHEGEEAQIGDPAELRGLSRVVGDGDRAREILPRDVPHHHA